MVTPIEKMCSLLPIKRSRASSFILSLVGIGILFALPLLTAPLGPRPDNHLPYTGGSAGSVFTALKSSSEAACRVDFDLYWTRRVLHNLINAVQVLVFLLFVVPKEHHWFTDLGKRALYAYLFHEFVHYWRDQLIASVGLPVVSSPAIHVAVVALHLLYCVALFCLLSSQPFRR